MQQTRLKRKDNLHRLPSLEWMSDCEAGVPQNQEQPPVEMGWSLSLEQEGGRGDFGGVGCSVLFKARWEAPLSFLPLSRSFCGSSQAPQLPVHCQPRSTT